MKNPLDDLITGRRRSRRRAWLLDFEDENDDEHNRAGSHRNYIGEESGQLGKNLISEEKVSGNQMRWD